MFSKKTTITTIILFSFFVIVCTLGIVKINLVYPNGRVGSVYAKEVCEKVGLKWVPIITDGYRLPGTVDEILQYAHGPSALGNTMREGIICRTRDGKRSFKAVDPQFLLKYNE